MVAPPEEEDVDIDSARLFTESARSILGRKFFRRFRVRPRIQPVIFVGRNVTTDAQTLDPLFDGNGKVPTTGGYLTDTRPVATASAWASLEVGDWDYFTTGSVAGNVAASLPSSTGTGEVIYEVHQILHTLDNDGTAASRVPTLVVVAGMPSISSALNDWSQVGATATAGENAKLFVPRGPAVVKINDNGTITDGATSPLPMLIGVAGTLSVTVAAGVAGDAHSLSALVRRVA